MDVVTLGAAKNFALQQTTADTIDARKTALLRTSYAKLGMRDSVPCDWMAIGDSTTEGARQTNAQARWVGRALKQLRSRLGQTATGGFGYIPAWYSTGDQQTPSPVTYWSNGSATSGSSAARGNYGLGRRSLVMNGNSSQKSVLTLTAGTPYASTSVDVIYAKTVNSTAGIDIYLDDVLLTSINTVVTAGNTSAGNRYRISGLAGGSHVIEVRATGGVDYFEGYMLYNGDETSGLRLWEAAASGSTSLWHATASIAGKDSPNFVYSYDNLVKIQPSLVTIMLGINDYNDGTGQQQTPAQYQANLVQILANIRSACTVNPSIVFLIQWQRGGTAQPNPWDAYKAAAYSVAAADGGVAVFDLSKRFPPGVQTTALSLINADLVHITDTGGAFVADAFVNWFLPR